MPDEHGTTGDIPDRTGEVFLKDSWGDTVRVSWTPGAVGVEFTGATTAVFDLTGEDDLMKALTAAWRGAKAWADNDGDDDDRS